VFQQIAMNFHVLSTFSGRHRFRSVAFSSDSRLLSAGCDDQVFVLDTLTGETIYSLDGHDDIINVVKFSNECSRKTMLASGSNDFNSLVWKLDTLNPIHPSQYITQTIPESFTYIRKSENSKAIASLAFCFNDRFVATASMDGSVRFISTGVVSNSQVKNMQCPTPSRIMAGQEICSIHVAVDNITLFVGFASGRLGILQTENGLLTASLKRHQLRITGISQCTEGLLLATGSWDKTVKLSRSCTPAETIGILRLESAVFSIAFYPRRTMLACGVGAPNNCVELWDFSTGARARLPAFQPAAHSVAFSPNGATLACTAPGRRIVLWDMHRRGACLALAMALHPRLGTGSLLAQLETGIIQLVAENLAGL
jgi:WD40 repeat protein